MAVSDAGVGAAALWDPPGRQVHTRVSSSRCPAILRAFRGG